MDELCKIHFPKTFNKQLRELLRSGKKSVVVKAQSAATEASLTGQISSLERTHHGESRLEKVEKYDLGDGYRLVVQLLDGETKQRAFLFVGSHDDAQLWLDAHKNHTWIHRSGEPLAFVQVTEDPVYRAPSVPPINVKATDRTLGKPLLSYLTIAEWDLFGVTSETLGRLKAITALDWESDQEAIFSWVASADGYEKAGLVVDVCTHAYQNEWGQLRERLNFVIGSAKELKPEEVAAVIGLKENSQEFFEAKAREDIESIFADKAWADWMLYLHPEQKGLVEREFNGPAQIRGISGSGKTCVLVQRAQRLARKYRQPILLVTLTGSMKLLLESLVRQLCGTEATYIEVVTLRQLASRVAHGGGTMRGSKVLKNNEDEYVFDNLWKDMEALQVPLMALLKTDSSAEAREFFESEIRYIRSQIQFSDLNSYLDPKAFPRTGRGIPLDESGRKVFKQMVDKYEEYLDTNNLLDHEAIVGAALNVLRGSNADVKNYRCVLVDEVQDLSQLELKLVASIKAPGLKPVSEMENGLLLVGDGAQTIYRKGSNLARAGLDTSGRRAVLKKSYRNSYEILRAAHALVEEYKLGDRDDGSIPKVEAPEYSSRHTDPPFLIECKDGRAESDVVVKLISGLLKVGEIPGQICIVWTYKAEREKMIERLRRVGIEAKIIKEDADFMNEIVKVSTIESAKGHEFGTVIIGGLFEGVIPSTGTSSDELWREASRLYVAMTRARDRLVLCASPSEGRTRSRFVDVIRPYCAEVSNESEILEG